MSIGGENTIAVLSINQETGEPTLIQTADTRGFHPRTFAIDPSGRVLVAANLTPLAVRDEQGVHTVPAGLSVFTIGSGGTLSFARNNDVEANPAAGRSLFWMGIAHCNRRHPQLESAHAEANLLWCEALVELCGRTGEGDFRQRCERTVSA